MNLEEDHGTPTLTQELARDCVAKSPDRQLMRARIEILQESLRLYQSAGAADPLVWRWLKSRGVNYDGILDLTGPICRDAVVFLEDGGFEYDPMGETAFLQLVVGEDAETPTDILAWSPYYPERFGTLLAAASVLGADRVVNPASYASGPCRLWRTPLRWLQTDCLGAVVLDTVKAKPLLARACGSLAAEDTDHGLQLLVGQAVRRDRLLVPAVRGAA